MREDPETDWYYQCLQEYQSAIKSILNVGWNDVILDEVAFSMAYANWELGENVVFFRWKGLEDYHSLCYLHSMEPRGYPWEKVEQEYLNWAEGKYIDSLLSCVSE